MPAKITSVAVAQGNVRRIYRLTRRRRAASKIRLQVGLCRDGVVELAGILEDV